MREGGVIDISSKTFTNNGDADSQFNGILLRFSSFLTKCYTGLTNLSHRLSHSSPRTLQALRKPDGRSSESPSPGLNANSQITGAGF
jgi:hypothetical protein